MKLKVSYSFSLAFGVGVARKDHYQVGQVCFAEIICLLQKILKQIFKNSLSVEKFGIFFDELNNCVISYVVFSGHYSNHFLTLRHS